MGRRLAACAVALMVLAGSISAHAGWAYRRAVTRATHDGKIYDPATWDARILWHATFFDDAFRQAFEKQHFALTHIDAENAAPFREEQAHRQAAGWDFFVALYTKEPYKKFTAFEDSFWKARLTTGTGEVLTPSAVEAIPVGPYELEMYRYLDRWSKAYRITFPKVPLGDRIELTISSVVGESTLSWKIKEK